MKRLYIYLIIGSFIMSCSSSGGSGGDTPEPKENQAPLKISSLTYPTNNLLCTSNTIEFRWVASSDPDGDAITYLLEISKSNTFSLIDESISLSKTFQMVTLEKGVAYYWRVTVKDDEGLNSDASDVYQFYTEGDPQVNHLPFSPSLVAPTVDQVLSASTFALEWEASDVDNDPLTYDVYFGATNPPATKVGNNQTEKTLNVNLTAATSYYWKVVVKDDKGGQTIGQVWSFSTN